MRREPESFVDLERLRAAFHDLAEGAREVPSRPVRFDGSRAVAGPRAATSVTWRRVTAAAAVLVVVAAAGVVAVRRSTDDRSRLTPTPTIPTTATTSTTIPVSRQWFVDLASDAVATLPSAPIAARTEPAHVWTGSEMIVWGGTSSGPVVPAPSFSDGAAFDPVSGHWRLLPRAPIGGLAYPATVWTGSEMIVWGASAANGFVEGAAFDPRTNVWRVLSPAPVGVGQVAAAWTGAEMIVAEVGPGVGAQGGGLAVAYDPIADSWRRLPDPPGPLARNQSLVWTGTSVLATTEPSAARTVKLIAYRPDVDEWQVIDERFSYSLLVAVPGIDVGVGDVAAVALSFEPGIPTQVLAASGKVVGEAPALQPGSFADLSQPSWTGREVLLWAGGDDGLAVDPVTGGRERFPAGDLRARSGAAVVWADGVLLAWGGFAPSAVGSTVLDDGVIYRPPNGPRRVPLPLPDPTSAVDVEDASIFDIMLFGAVSVEQAIVDLSVPLGPPTADSQWQPMPIEFRCTRADAYRVVWWGDLRMSFERHGEPEVLSEWSVGDPTVYRLAPIGDVPPLTPSGVEMRGVGVGATHDEVRAALPGELVLQDEPESLTVLAGGLVVVFAFDGDVVTGFGSGRMDCIDDSQV